MGILTGGERRGAVVSVKEVLKGVARGADPLPDVVRHWGAVAGAAARSSAPYDLSDGTLYIAARSSHTAQRLEQMKGNIRRALGERWGLEIREIRVTLGTPPPRRRRADPGPRRRHIWLEPGEEEVRAFREQCPPNLSPEAAEALAHLRAFFVKRFGG